MGAISNNLAPSQLPFDSGTPAALHKPLPAQSWRTMCGPLKSIHEHRHHEPPLCEHLKSSIVTRRQTQAKAGVKTYRLGAAAAADLFSRRIWVNCLPGAILHVESGDANKILRVRHQ